MPYIPGQKDPLFEAVKGVVTGKTQEGHYARNVLGYEPMQESVRVMEIDPERRERTAESLMGRTGQVGAPGFRYGQRVYYDGEPYRIESFHEADRFYPDLRLTLVDDEFTRRISGVDAIEVTVPTETTAMGEDAEPLEEARGLMGTLADYMARGEILFLQVAVKQIKKVAGRKAEKVAVERAGSTTSFLSYDGQDARDMDLDFMAQLIVKRPDVKVLISVKSAYAGSNDEELSMKIGQLKPEAITHVFRRYFGGR
jgi:hypothetical protein